MMNTRHRREMLKIVLLCMAWYTVSINSNVIGKMVLSEFPFPMTVTMVQLTSIVAYSGPVFTLWGVRNYNNNISWALYIKLFMPIALGKFISNVFNHVSIWKVPVSYAHTVKATMPLFTVILSRIILHEKQTWKVYWSLLPIVGGVTIATMTELSFNVIGLLSALASTLVVSLVNIFSKKVLKETGIHHLRLLYVVGQLAAVMFLPIWLVSDSVGVMSHWHETPFEVNLKIFGLLIIDGLMNWLQNIFAFSVLSLVTPLTFAVASASKRIFIIAVTLFILGNPVTGLNVFGMMLAIFGVLGYNKAKYDQRQQENQHTILPSHLKVSKLNGHSSLMPNGWSSTTRLIAI